MHDRPPCPFRSERVDTECRQCSFIQRDFGLRLFGFRAGDLQVYEPRSPQDNAALPTKIELGKPHSRRTDPQTHLLISRA